MVVTTNTMPVGLNQGISRTQPSVNLPVFMVSRSEPKMSDEEFKVKIVEMARRDAAAGRFQSHDVNSEFHTLRRNYVSVVSPDRQGIINRAMPAVVQKIKSMEHNISHLQLFLGALFGGDMLHALPHMRTGQEIHIAEFKDEFGNI